MQIMITIDLSQVAWSVMLPVQQDALQRIVVNGSTLYLLRFPSPLTQQSITVSIYNVVEKSFFNISRYLSNPPYLTQSLPYLAFAVPRTNTRHRLAWTGK